MFKLRPYIPLNSQLLTAINPSWMKTFRERESSLFNDGFQPVSYFTVVMLVKSGDQTWKPEANSLHWASLCNIWEVSSKIINRRWTSQEVEETRVSNSIFFFGLSGTRQHTLYNAAEQNSEDLRSIQSKRFVTTSTFYNSIQQYLISIRFTAWQSLMTF